MRNKVCIFIALVLSIMSILSLGTKVLAADSGTTNKSTITSESGDCKGDNIHAGASADDENHCGILDYLVLFINILSGLATIAIVGSIIYAGIQYSMSGSDPQKVSAAKDRIRNAVIALIFFVFGYTILNYLVPGGVL